MPAKPGFRRAAQLNEQSPLTDWLTWMATPETRAAVAGAAGGVVRWITLREKPRVGITSIIVGAICSIYLQPLVVPLLEPVVKFAPDANVAGFAGFVVGLAGTTVSGLLIDFFRLRRAEIKKGAQHGNDADP